MKKSNYLFMLLALSAFFLLWSNAGIVAHDLFIGEFSDLMLSSLFAINKANRMNCLDIITQVMMRHQPIQK